jgi:hypothetical protein
MRSLSRCTRRASDDVMRVADAGGVMPRRALGSSPSFAPAWSFDCSTNREAV